MFQAVGLANVNALEEGQPYLDPRESSGKCKEKYTGPVMGTQRRATGVQGFLEQPHPSQAEEQDEMCF